jgi:nicotinate-nucleotide adenylyltransferase
LASLITFGLSHGRPTLACYLPTTPFAWGPVLKRNPPIGILGGTFDPIHHGHLRSAVEVAQNLNLAEVRLIPCGQPPHRPAPFASAQQRLAMVKLAAAAEPLLQVDDREIRANRPSYTVLTLESLRQELPDTPLCLILGMDAFCGLNLWYQWEKLLTLAHIIIIDRGPGGPALPSVVQTLYQQHHTTDPLSLKNQLCGIIYRQPISCLAISATQLRNDVAVGRNIRFLVPEVVLTYIATHHLYQPS